MFGENSLRVRVMRHLGATRMLTLSFLLVIFTGSILLSLPIANQVEPLSYLDNLFISTSSVCVTGLVTYNVMDQYNYFGYTVLMFLIQIGGLGVMSLIAFILTITKHRLYHSEKRMLQDALNKDTLQDIPKFLKSIIKYTFFFESIGAIIIMFRFIPIYGVGAGIYHSIFLSISAFCNAGIDTISHVSLAEYVTDPLINIVVASLIVIGGLGFTVWFDLRKHFKEKNEKKFTYKKLWTTLSLHTKVILTATVGLILSGAVLVFVVEYGNPNSLGELSLLEKIQASLFQSVTLRTAGFSTLDFSQLHDASLFYMIFYMIIGGSPGGTAGGIKTTALVLLILFIKSQLSGNDKLVVFKRSLSTETFHKAFMVFVMYFVLVISACFILSISESVEFLPLLFEISSAIGTVGLSAGVTPILTSIGKIVIIILMFMGRVGPITIILSMMKKSANKSKEIEYPHGEILIG